MDSSSDEDKKKKSPSKPRKANPWIAHVAEFRKKHPEMKYSEVLKKAKDSYKKK
jgi:hypothetical protein